MANLVNVSKTLQLEKDATVNEAGGAYAGLDRFEARARLWKDMEAAWVWVRGDCWL